MIYMNIDLSDLEDILKVEEAANKEGKDALRALTAATHGKLIELANSKLHSRRQKYIESVSMFEEGEGVFVVNLDASARWIEDGMCVVYAKGHEPSVLTPDGWVKTPDVRIGMLVLNRFGRWTAITAVHDNDLYDYCVEFVDEEATRLLGVKKKKFDHHKGSGRRSKKPVVARCPSCNGTRITSRFAMTDGAGTSHCTSCMKKKELVSLSVGVPDGYEKITLTAEHKVLTGRGWVEARDLQHTDVVFVPAWGKCKFRSCQKKTSFGRGFCSQSCRSSEQNYVKLDNGTHVSQDPLWKAKYYKNLGRNKVSNIEDVVADLIAKTTNQTVGFFGDGDFDWIRQYRIESSVDRMGRRKYYFLDFYNAKLGLALEIDGHFHFTTDGVKKEAVRDRALLDRGIRPVHIPVAQVSSGVFEKTTLPALIANHSGDIEMVPAPICELRKFHPNRSTPLHRRWDITVADGSSFVCQGIVIHNSEGDMLEDLLKSKKVKRAKDGSSYLVVPFQHNKAKNQQTPAQQSLMSTIRSQMALEGASPAKLDMDEKGKPKLGLVKSMDITKAPTSTQALRIGRGPLGQVAQGATGGIPILKGIRVYQKEYKDRAGNTKVGRYIMTFRVASSKHRGTGKWQREHPLEGVNLMDEAMKWALEQWEQKIAPSILAKITAEIK